jgi:hypothetical protein
MSYPVFLNAASEPRIPDGGRNEWKAFWADDAIELEGNGWPPLLWLALFKVSDMRWARVVDDEDLDSEGREDLQEFGDATYPYLVTSRDSALATLAGRRKVILDGIGEHLAPVLDAFAALIGTDFPRFVLCRTSGMVDIADAGPALEKSLVDFDRLVSEDTQDNSIAAAMADLRKYPADTQRFLLVGVRQGVASADAPLAETPVRSQTPDKKTARRSSELLDWISALIVGIPAVVVYLRLHAVFPAVLTFCALVAVVVFVRVKLLR